MNNRNRFTTALLCLILVLTLGAVQLPAAGRPLAATLPADAAPPADALSVAWAAWRDASDAEQVIQRAWLLAQVADVYTFRTELVQTTYSAPALTNVGRPAEVETLYMEGQTDRQNETLQMALWQGGSVLQPEDALEMRIADGKAYGRAAGSDWQEMDDFSGMIAPDQDPLGYLHGARDMREVTSAEPGVRQFSFAVDGPTFAAYMREQLENELRRSGKLPANLSLDSARVYRDMIGDGQLWLTADGLPLRLEMAIAFPQQSDGSRVKAVIRSDFSGFAGVTAAAYHQAGSSPLASVAYDSTLPPAVSSMAARLLLVDWGALAGRLAALLLVGVAMLALAVWGRRPLVRAALSVTIIAMMVFAPLLDAQQAQAFYAEQTAAQQEQAEQQAAQALADRLLTSTWDPTQDPLAAAEAQATPAPQGLTRTSLDAPLSAMPSAALAVTAGNDPLPDADKDGVPDRDERPGCELKPDCDADTLTDLQESRLGTLSDNPDTDGDTLRDDMEVKGFGVTDKTLAGKWYSDPNNFDTNRDGLPDNQECWQDATLESIAAWPATTPCDKDSDSDGVPDIFDTDNDDDGIDDIRDLSPFNASSAVYNQANPFLLQVEGLMPNEPLFVDLQLVPTSPQQVGYSRNVLDWPSGDTIGQVQRTADNTFADGLSAAQLAADPSPKNGDMRLVPMVEIKIPADAASNLLPTIQALTTPRSVTGYKEVQTGEGEDAEKEMQVWLQAQLEFRAENGNTTLAFTSLKDNVGGNVTVDRVKVFNTAECPVAPDAAPQFERGATAAGELWSLPGVALPALLDGTHVIMLESGSGAGLTTACQPLGDVPNGGLGDGVMFNSDKLDDYGAMVRDVLDANKVATHVAVYLPANVVVGRTGGEKQGFAIRMPYWPKENITSLGAAQEVRLIWMVQLLEDDGGLQIIHTYSNESWRLAGLTARQDIEMRSAVFYQNPDDADNAAANIKAIQSRMWDLAKLLGSRFAIDPVGKDRLALNDQLLPKLQQAPHNLPAGSIGAVLTTYETQDEVARVPAEVTPGILANFVSGGVYKSGYDHALLLFAREEDYGATVWNGGALQLPPATSTLASYNWKPFRYTAEGWKPYPAGEYLDLISVRLGDTLKAAAAAGKIDLGQEAPEEARAGMVAAGQMYVQGMFSGGNQLVKVADQAIEIELTEEENDSTIEDMGGEIETMLSKVADLVVEDLATKLLTTPLKVHTAVGAARLGGALNKAANLPEPEDLFETVNGHLGVGLAVASFATAGVAIGLMIAGLLGEDVETASNVVGVVSAALNIISSTMAVVKAVKDLTQPATAAATATGATLGGAASAGTALSKASLAASSASNAAKAATIAAVVGLVITIGIAVGVFIMQWAMGAFSLTDLAFTAAMAGLIATVIVAVIMFAIAFIPVVGPIIVAVIGLIDAAIAGICAVSKAAGYDLEEAPDEDGDGEPDYQVPVIEVPGGSGAELSFCKGLSGLMTTAVQVMIFSQNVLVGNMKGDEGKDRLKTSNFALNLTDTTLGFQQGNTFRPSLRVDNKIVLIDQPLDWKSAVYFWQLNWDNLDSATHRYDLVETEEDDRDVDRNEMESEWQEMDAAGKLTGGHASPGIQYDDPLHMVPDTSVDLPAGAPAVEFTTAGINVPIPLYLREAYANPTQECWGIPIIPPLPPYVIPICYIRSDDGNNHVDLKLQFDVFPPTLDAFYTPVDKDGGYSLAWGQAGDVTFPAMMDFDGDGLLSPAYGGADPDDRYWDADGDGLSDLFELNKGTNPALLDSDRDGLSDRQELILGTNPLRADHDGDGLLDCEETFHAVLAADQYARCGAVSTPPVWRGGWEFVYDLDKGQPSKTWVASDPKSLDGDGDALTDYQEKLYGLNPRVKSDPTILKLESVVREATAPAMLLRLEERAGANLFGDTSGLTNNATCNGTACPIAGHEGKYTNGLVFDGVDDKLVVKSSVALANTSFTIAAWVRRSDATTADQFVFTSGSAQPYRGLHVGFRQNQFMCAFWGESLMTSAAYTETDWHHWACTYNAGTRQRTIYRDGIQVAQDTTAAHYQGSGDWYIGSWLNGSERYFKGMLDEVAVFPTAFNAAQIQAVAEARYNPGGAQVAVKPGDALTYDATLTNNLMGKQLTGLLWAEAPVGWTGAVAPAAYQTYRIGAAGTQSLQGNVTVAGAAASGAYSLTLTAGAAAADPETPVPPVAPPPAFSPPAGFWGKWTFDGDYTDSSGYGRHGAPGGVRAQPSFTPGFKNQSLDFNSNNGAFVTLPQDATTTDNFTFAAWVFWRNDGRQEWERIFDFGQDTNNFMMLTPWDAWGQVEFKIKKNNAEQIVWTPAGEMPYNTWTHVAVVLDSSTNSGKIYINGVDRTNPQSHAITLRPRAILNTNSLLGKSKIYDNSDGYFHGRLDEVYIYHTALNAAEVQQLALAGVTDIDNRNTEPGLAAYLPFDTHYLDYNSANDSRVPQGNAIPGGRTYLVTAAPFMGGVKGGAMNLDGQGLYTTLPENVADTEQFTFAAWVFWRGNPRYSPRVFDFGRGPGDSLGLMPAYVDKNSHLTFFIVKNGNWQFLEAPSTLPKNTWVHVAVSLDGTTGRLYVNGVEVKNAPITHKPKDVKGVNTWLGKGEYSRDSTFDGLLDEVRIYHRALSAAEIDKLLLKESRTDIQFTFDNAAARFAYAPNSAATLRTGQAAYATGFDNKSALILDGKTVLEANSPTFDMSNTDFSYSVWIKPDANAAGVQAVWGQPPVGRDWQEANQGLSLLVENGTDVKFGWGGPTPWVLKDNAGEEWHKNKLLKGAWNHVAVTFNAGTVTLYVNGDRVASSSTPTRPPVMYSFAVGETNLCAEFSLKAVYTVYETMLRSFKYFFIDDMGVQYTMVKDDNADAGDWEPGDNQWAWWRDERNYTFCGPAVVWVFGTYAPLGPIKEFDMATPHRVGYTPNNYQQFSSGHISGDGAVEYFYEIHNPTLPFRGLLDDLRMMRRAMTEEEVQLLYAAGALPYHFTLDDAPGAGLNTSVFNFKNQGAIAKAEAEGKCAPGACPTSGLPGRVNQAVQFASNQSIQIANLDLPATPPGISFWANPSASGQLLRLQTPKSVYDTQAPVLTARYSANAFCLDLQASYLSTSPLSVCSAASYPAGQWYHVMLIYSNDATSVSLYVNGASAVSLTRPQVVQGPPCSYRGWPFLGWQCPLLTMWETGKSTLILGGGFSGLLDDLRIPYDGSVAAVGRMLATAPLVSLHLQESGQNVTSFATLGGAPATCTGAACPKAGVKGKVSQAASLDGLNDALSIPDSAQLDLSTYTLAAWVKPTAGTLNPTSWYSILNKEGPGLARNYSIWMNGAGQVHISHFICGGSLQSVTSDTPLPLNQYTHVAATYNGRELKLYLNGVLHKAVTAAPGCQNNAPLVIGGNFSGDLDEIQVYNYALYAYQIKNIFEFQNNWIEEENAYTVWVDGDNPTSTLTGALPNPTTYYANQDVQVGVQAKDPTGVVALLELGLSRNGGAVVWTAGEACEGAGETDAGSPAWCPWFKPTALGGEGRYELRTRATDAVGNREGDTTAPARTILVDAAGPALTVAQADGSVQALQAHPTQANAQALLLNGTALDPALSSGDPGSGIAAVWVTLRNADGELVGNAPYPAPVSGADWTLTYPFPPTPVAGPYYLAVTAADAVGNETALSVRTLYLDGTAPGVELDETASALPTSASGAFVKGDTTLRGVISERPFPVGAAAAYHFEESAGATSFANAAASSGWQNPGHATCSGAACPTAGGAGRAGAGLSFDGVDDRVVIADSPELRLNRFTLSLWVNPAQTPSDFVPLLAKSDADATRINYALWFMPETTQIFYYGHKADCAEYIMTNNSASLPLNAWSHVALTYDGANLTLYINGVADNTTPLTGGLCQTSDAVQLGSLENDLTAFSGMVDEVAIYPHALSPDEIRVLAAPQVSGLQAAAVAFSPLWANEPGGASPHLDPTLAGQTLYLPLDDPRDQNGNTTFRNLANPAAPARCTGATCPDPGGSSPGGPAVSFDGQDDSISLQPGQPLNDNFTFAAWVYRPVEGSGLSRYVLTSDGPSGSVQMSTSDYETSFFIRYGSQYEILSGPALSPNAWGHVALTLQDTTCVLYLNGTEAARSTITLNPSQSAGSGAQVGFLFKGQLSDVRIFSRGLSAAEIQTLRVGNRALLALPLDDSFMSNGASLSDASAWKHTVTLNTGVGDTANKAAPGISGPYALSFDGVDDQVLVADAPELRLDRFTLSLWVNPAQTKADWQPLLIKSDANATKRNYSLWIVPNTTQINYYVNTADCVAEVGGGSTAALPLNAWSHVALTYDGAALTLYINGVADSTTPLTGGLCQTSAAVQLGRLESAYTAFAGMLDQVNVYPRALLPAEITDLAQSGWRTVALSGEQAAWSLPIPAGMEGAYRLDLRGVDTANHTSFNGQKATPNLSIDSLAPRATLTRYTGGNWGNQYRYTFTAEDLYLSEPGLFTPCGGNGTLVKTTRLDPANGQPVLTKLVVECTLAQPAADEIAAVCDVADNCAIIYATQAQAAPTSLWTYAAGGRSVLARALFAGRPEGIAQTPARLTPAGADEARVSQSAMPRVGITAPTAGETCFTTLDDGATVYSSTTSQAVRDAIAAASPDGTVKIAGTCAGVETDHLASIYITLTLAGGYTLTNWLTPDPAVYPTVLDVQSGGRGIFTAAPVTLTGLTIQNGAFTGTGGGAFFYGPAVLADVTFINNTATSDAGGAFFNYAATLSDVAFINNTATGDGGGALFYDTASMVNTTFTGNRASLSGGGAAFAYGTKE